MLIRTHLAGGVLAFAALAIATGPLTYEEAAVEFAYCMIGSIIPDIDQQQSKISKSDILIGAVSEMVCTFTKHRGITHTPLGCLLFAVLGYSVAKIAIPYANANAAFMAALIVFAIIHSDSRKKKLNKFGGMLAIGTYIYYPHVAEAVTCLPEIVINQGYEMLIGVSVLTGALSHLLLDMFNPEGCMLFYPFRKRFNILSIRTGSRSEIFVTAVLFISAVLLIWFYRNSIFITGAM